MVSENRVCDNKIVPISQRCETCHYAKKIDSFLNFGNERGIYACLRKALYQNGYVNGINVCSWWKSRKE